jgi:hypothetical protein
MRHLLLGLGGFEFAEHAEHQAARPAEQARQRYPQLSRLGPRLAPAQQMVQFAGQGQAPPMPSSTSTNDREDRDPEKTRGSGAGGLGAPCKSDPRRAEIFPCCCLTASRGKMSPTHRT